jgi:hypothetical protein
VFLVKLDRGSEYGGSMAAPVTRTTLAAALAARSSPLDRRAVAAQLPDAPRAAAGGAGWTGGVVGAGPNRLPPTPGPYVFRIAAGPPQAAPVRSGLRRVPDVRGSSARDAAADLHASGFHVQVEGVGTVRDTEPRAGSAAEQGSVVRLQLARSR